MPVTDAKISRFSVLLFELIQHLNHLQTECGEDECSLSRQETRAIEFLGRLGPCRMKDLAERLGLAVSSATTLVDNLEAKEVVRRTRSESDRRVVKVSLTEEGAQGYQLVSDVFNEMAGRILGSLDEPNQDRLIEAFQKLGVG